jgi:hypothetical protein
MWIDVEIEMPEEDLTLLVYLDCDQVGLGRWFEGEWDIQAAPWEGLCDANSRVLFWMYIPRRQAS